MNLYVETPEEDSDYTLGKIIVQRVFRVRHKDGEEFLLATFDPKPNSKYANDYMLIGDEMISVVVPVDDDE